MSSTMRTRIWSAMSGGDASGRLRGWVGGGGPGDRPARCRPIGPPWLRVRCDLGVVAPGADVVRDGARQRRRLDDLDDGRRQDPEVVDDAAERDPGGGDGRAVGQAVDGLGGAVL